MRVHELCIGAVAAAAFLSALPAAAQPDASASTELRGGLYAHGVGPLSHRKEDGVAVNAEILFPSPSFLSVVGAPRPHIGGNYATRSGATSQVYAGLTWRLPLIERTFFEAAGGVAVHTGETDFSPDDPNIATTTYFGCRAHFRLAADLGYMLTDRLSVSLHADHISNAGLCSENEGLDSSGVRIGYRF